MKLIAKDVGSLGRAYAVIKENLGLEGLESWASGTNYYASIPFSYAFTLEDVDGELQQVGLWRPWDGNLYVFPIPRKFDPKMQDDNL